MKRLVWIPLSIALLLSGMAASAKAQIVPGTGERIDRVGDDFEAEDWGYDFNLPKSTKNLNEYTGGAGGRSLNRRWFEGVKRGQPDIIERVPTPEGGIAGSTGSMLLRSLHTGIPRRPSGRLQQDDFICDVQYRHGMIPVSRSPNVVTRVYLPPFEEWENRTGPSFAFRLALTANVRKRENTGGLFSRTRNATENETYWPGMFIEFNSETDRRHEQDSAWIRVRANTRGGDYPALQIEQLGWWTLGLSVTPDGRVHYYASPGVDPLTAEDHIASDLPYSYRAQYFKTFFFNVCNGDNGRTWSTSWVVDDSEVFQVIR